MRKIREVLRLRHAMGLSRRKIGPMVGVGQTTVREYLGRAEQAGLSWPLPAGLEDDEALERLLFPPPPALPAAERGVPDWALIHRELRRKGVTLQLLWQEYRACHPDGFGYSWFCETYRAFAGKLSPTLRRTHPAGERMFVDYAGQTAEVIDPLTGEVRAAQVFIAVLGASSYTFATVTWTQDLEDWVMAHVEAFAFFGGVPVQVVCDNLKSGVTKPSRYEPTLTATYREMAAHYQVAILPARVRKPRDKAKVEVAVQVVERWILARLRNRRFFSLAELKAAVADLLTDLNGRVTRHLGTSRRALFEDLDRPALRPLPDRPCEYAEWQHRRVGIDYHVEAERHFYSVPYRLLKETVDVRLTAGAVEIFHKGKRVSCAPGHSACRYNLSVLYARTPRLLEDIALARADGRYPRLLKSLAKLNLLILDDFGVAPMTTEQRRHLLEIIDDRAGGTRATIVTSQLPVAEWHTAIGDATLADAILDRLVHSAHRIELKGESLRKRRRPKEQT